jgi:hypothetical protein
VGTGIFPLDARLGLLPSKHSPHIVHCLVRLGTCLPFEQVPALAQVLLGVAVSA